MDALLCSVQAHKNESFGRCFELRNIKTTTKCFMILNWNLLWQSLRLLLQHQEKEVCEVRAGPMSAVWWGNMAQNWPITNQWATFQLWTVLFPRFEQFYNFSSIEIAIFARKLHWIQWGCVLYRSFKLLVFINFHHFTWTCRLFIGFLWLCTPGLHSEHHYFKVKEMVALSCEFQINEKFYVFFVFLYSSFFVLAYWRTFM